MGGSVFFTVLFGICGILQLVIGIKCRTWTLMTALVIAAFMEMIGYIGRALMNRNPWNQSAFEQQVTCLIIAPSFVAAGIYWSVKHIVLLVNPTTSRLPPRLYPWIFIGCDIGSIFVQAAGGGVASGRDKKTVDTGNDIMIAGIAFQVATMAVCGLLAVDFAFRAYKNGDFGNTRTEKPSPFMKRFYTFCAAEILAYVTVLIRCIYRYVRPPPTSLCSIMKC